MNGYEELVRRLALKRQRQLGSLSDEAFSELELAVRENPEGFIDDSEEQAFYVVAQALGRMADSRHDDDLLDDEQYQQARRKRLDALDAACKEALSYDEGCIDARMLVALARDMAPNDLLEWALDVNKGLVRELGTVAMPAAGDAWANVFVRPRLRLQDLIARTCLATARYSMARDWCLDLLGVAPLDALGARLTCALAMARLEDEEGFNWLDAREGRRGNAWFHLSRALLMYKLGRMPAARRALRGYDRLCPGGAYALLQPMFIDTYLPDRPAYTPGTFEEALLAVHEADPIIVDVPDFCRWACMVVPDFLRSAKRYCDSNGFEWRDWNE